MRMLSVHLSRSYVALVLLGLPIYVEAAQFFQHPASAEAQCSDPVHFHCQADRSTILLWTIKKANDTTERSPSVFSNDLKSSNYGEWNGTAVSGALTLSTCEAKYNSSSIKCYAMNPDFTVTGISEPATLTLLPSISRVDNIQFNDVRNRLYWNQVQQVGFNQLVSYNVSLYDLTTNTVISENHQTSYWYMPVDYNKIAYCRRYQAKITPYIDEVITGEMVQQQIDLPDYWPESFLIIQSIELISSSGATDLIKVNLAFRDRHSFLCPGQFLSISYNTTEAHAGYMERDTTVRSAVFMKTDNSSETYRIVARIVDSYCNIHDEKDVILSKHDSYDSSGVGDKIAIADVKPSLCAPVIPVLSTPRASPTQTGTEQASTSNIMPTSAISQPCVSKECELLAPTLTSDENQDNGSWLSLKTATFIVGAVDVLLIIATIGLVVLDRLCNKADQ